MAPRGANAAVGKDVFKDLTAAGKVAVASVHLGEGLLYYVFLLYVFVAPLALIMFAGGLFVLTRRLFFLSVPYLIATAPFDVGVINTFGDAVVLFVDAMLFAYDGLSQTIAAIVNTIPGVHWHPKILPPVGFVDVTVEQYTSVLKTAAEECHDIDSIGAVWSITALPALSDATCPYFRAVTPLLGNGFHSAVSFMSHDPTPLPGNNCNGDHKDVYSAELCTFLASGYLLLEILLPLFLLGLLLMAAGNSLYSLLEYSIKLVVDVCEQLALVLIK